MGPGTSGWNGAPSTCPRWSCHVPSAHVATVIGGWELLMDVFISHLGLGSGTPNSGNRARSSPSLWLSHEYQEKSWPLETPGLSEAVNCSMGRSGVVTGRAVVARVDSRRQVLLPPQGSRAFSPSLRFSGAWSLGGSGDFQGQWASHGHDLGS